MAESVLALLSNLVQVGAAGLVLVAAAGYGRFAARTCGFAQRGSAAGSFGVLVGIAMLTGLSGWLCWSWAFTREAGVVVLVGGWLLFVPALPGICVRAATLPRSVLKKPPGARSAALLGGGMLIVFVALLTIRAFAHEFAWADDWRYHLTLPQRILVDAGLRYDAFMPEANMNYGGAHGLHALCLLVGDPVTYQMISPAAGVLLLALLLFEIMRSRFGRWPALGGLAAMLGGGFLWRMGFITLSPDVLTAALVTGLLWLFLEHASRKTHLGLGVVAGLLCGALLAFKTTNLFVLPFFAAGYFLSCRQARTLSLKRCVEFASGTALGVSVSLLPWVWIEWRNTGSPLYPFIGDRRDVFAWMLARNLVLLDAPEGLASWIWKIVRAQYGSFAGGLLWTYALVLPAVALRLRNRRAHPTRLNHRNLPLAVTLPPALLFSAYLIYSRGADLDTHMRYLMPLALPGIALVCGWCLHRCRAAARGMPAVPRHVATSALIILVLLNVFGSRDDIITRGLAPALSAGRALAWGDLSRRFWEARRKSPPYGDIDGLIPPKATVLTFVQKTALIDTSRHEVSSITKALTGRVDVHAYTEPRRLATVLRLHGFEYVVLTLEWLDGPRRAAQQAPSKLSDWTATAQTLENLVRLRELDDVETMRQGPGWLILRLLPDDSGPRATRSEAAPPLGPGALAAQR